MTADPYKYFRIEARELVDELSRGALDLEKQGPSEAVLARLLRVAHTLKGAARVVKQHAIAEQAHALEDIFDAIRVSGRAPSDDQMTRLLELIDRIVAQVAALSAGGADTAPAPRTAAPVEASGASRPDSAELDALLDGVAQANTSVQRMRPRLQRAERARHDFDLIDRQLSQLRARDGVAAAERRMIDKTLALIEDLRRDVVNLHRGLDADLDQLDRTVGDIGERAAALHLLPLSGMFQFLERATRDAAKALQKRVVFEASGGAIRIEAATLSIIQGALLQTIRNAVAHGIEASEPDRRAAGKPPAGTVRITAVRQGMALTFTCVDDGRGVDVAAVQHTLRRRGVAPVPATIEALLDLLLKGGLSTSGTVTDLSGRGVGLDVVRAAADRLGGTATMTTDPGRGTAVILTVPSSFAAVPALLVDAADCSAAIPLDAVRRTIRVAPADVVESAAGRSLVVDGQAMPLTSLPAVMRPGAIAAAATAASAVVIESGGRQAALTFDRVRVGSVLVRPLPAMVPPLPLVAGLALDPGGSLRLVLEPPALLIESSRQDRQQFAPPAAKAAILVVDDSLTTRLLEQSILEAAGYDVTLASSGEEGLERARAGAFSLALVDVEMPGMDGFALIEHLRRDPRLQHLPAILVTSRASAEDRQRGRDAGAQGYIVKGEFDQSVFLTQIRALLP